MVVDTGLFYLQLGWGSGCSGRGEYLGGGEGGLEGEGGNPCGNFSGESGKGNLNVLVSIHGLDFFFHWVT